MSTSSDRSATVSWKPAASPAVLRRRARLMDDVRAFFRERGVLEVETPCLSPAAATDPHLHSLRTRLADGRRYYLHTSPEFPMKRLLAAGSGPIWQACRVFRDGEAGRRHNPEFTMLEWYRPGFGVDALMDEIEALVTTVGGPAGPARRIPWRDAFRDAVGVDPFAADAESLAARGRELGVEARGLDRDAWLDLLFSEAVCARLPAGEPVFITRFPAEQAALARLCPDDPRCADRFEFFVGPLELANGYHELTDAGEQRARFERDLARRREAGLPELPRDERLLAALEAGMPDASGVALGLDRLLMSLTGTSSISEVLAFPADLA